MANTVELKRSKTAVNTFTLVGTPKINDYTFNMNRTSEKSDWIWNTLNLGVNCGESGTIYCDMNSGYGENRDNVVYVHGKKEDDNGKMVDDFTNRFTIDWNDRFKSKVLEEIGDFCFIKIGLETDVKGFTVEKRFLTAYDAIQYIQEVLTEDMVINVKGNLKYKEYDGVTQITKEVTSIFLSKAKPDEYRATFVQSILCDYDFLGKLNKESNSYSLSAYVIDYVGKYNGKQIKKNFAYTMPYEFGLLKNDEDGEKTKKVINAYFKPKKKSEVCEINVEGKITKNGTTIDIVDSDIPDDIKALIEMGVYTEAEIMDKATGGGNKRETYLITRPVVKAIKSDDGTTTTAIQFNKNAYDIDSLVFFSSLEFDDEDDEDTSIKAKAETKTKKAEPKEEEDEFDLDELFGDDDD